MATEVELISRLRNKMGDNPTYILEAVDVDTNVVLIDGTAKVATDADIGLEAQKIAEQIWNNAEYLVELTSATIQLTKGKKTLAELGDFSLELVLIRSEMNLVYVLAIDAVRYLKYSTRDLDVEKMSPTQFLELHRSLGVFLKELMAEDNDEDPEIGNLETTVQQSIVRRYDDVTGAMVPSRYNPPQNKLRFNLTDVADGVSIHVMYSFVPDYAEHFIMKKIGSGISELLASFNVLEEHTYIDTDVIDTTLYTYELHVRSVNGGTQFVTNQITYAKP